MNQKLLGELKSHQKQRDEVSPFPSHLEFQRWADRVLPLLKFNQNLSNQFKHCVRAANLTHISGGTQDVDSNVNRAIGLLNQAVDELRIELDNQNLLSQSTNRELDAPAKVTLKWLWEHVPVSLVLSGLALLCGSFMLGIAFSELPIYKLIKEQMNSAVEPKFAASKSKN